MVLSSPRPRWTLLRSRFVEATPVGFASALGRLAFAGTVGKGAPVATATGILGGSILMNKALIGVATIVITALIAWYVTSRPYMPLNPVQPAPAALAQPESTPSETISTIHPVDTSQLADTLEATLGPRKRRPKQMNRHRKARSSKASCAISPALRSRERPSISRKNPRKILCWVNRRSRVPEPTAGFA